MHAHVYKRAYLIMIMIDIMHMAIGSERCANYSTVGRNLKGKANVTFCLYEQ